MTRALVLASPTLDIVDGLARPGGPPLYSGLAALRFGCRAAAAGPLGVEAAWLAGVLEEAGVHYLGPVYPGPPYTFKLRVGGGERRVTPAGRPSTASLGAVEAGGAAASARPDVVIAAPVGFEVPPQALVAASAGARVVAVDAQGYARSVGSAWPGLLPRGLYTLLHYSAEEAPRGTPLPGLVFETRGPRRGRVLLDGRVVAWIPEPARVLEDPTGAGDAFTAIVACCMAEDWDPAACAGHAVEMVPGVVEEAHEIAASHAVRVAGPQRLSGAL